tara:strand:- start:21245 stop:21412 length:168 start_codon:yes stop_codon:yes gene_type:complete
MTPEQQNEFIQQMTSSLEPTQMDGIREEATTTEVLSALDSPAHLEHIKKLLGGEQ